MNCADAELLICDYATLASAERFELERHIAQCPACAELARDSAAALAFMERAADVEPPQELITRILHDPPWIKSARKPKSAHGWLAGILSPILQPRFAMGMAMTILSLSMLARFVAPVRQLRPSDLEPAKVWATLDDNAHRAWARTVKYYENLKVVYQIQTMLRDWQQQDEERRPAAAEKPEPKTDERKLPVKAAPQPQAPSPSGASH
jgi:hypothetical protein